MKHHDHHHCPICAAEFASKSDLDRHEKQRHTQQGISGIAPSNEYPPRGDAPESPRKNHQFTRRNPE